MGRYKVCSDWTDADDMYDPFIIQAADIVDSKGGRAYVDGARRVIDARTGKPTHKGKGGTVPFYGEMAWSEAERLASDLWWESRFSR